VGPDFSEKLSRFSFFELNKIRWKNAPISIFRQQAKG